MTMFERMTDRARRVITLAQEEARILNHNYIGTEHLLLGLIHEGEGVAVQVLIKLGVDLNQLRVGTLRLLGVEGTEVPRRPPLERDAVYPVDIGLPAGVHIVLYNVPKADRKEVLLEVADRLRDWAARL